MLAFTACTAASKPPSWIGRMKTRMLVPKPRTEREYAPKKSKATKKGIVLGSYNENGVSYGTLTASGVKLNETLKGYILQAMRLFNLTGQFGVGRVFNNVNAEFRSIAVIGLGTKEALLDPHVKKESVLIAAAMGARSLQLQGMTEVHVDTMGCTEQAAKGSAAILHWLDSRESQLAIPKLKLYDSDDIIHWRHGLEVGEAEGQLFVLNCLLSRLPNEEAFIKFVMDELTPLGIKIRLRNMAWMDKRSTDMLIMQIAYQGDTINNPPTILLNKQMTCNSDFMGQCMKKELKTRVFVADTVNIIASLRSAAKQLLNGNIIGYLCISKNERQLTKAFQKKKAQ